MPTIVLYTAIQAPQQLCFDLSRSIDLHSISVSSTKEQAIAGITTGIINKDETVTWRARHFGIWMELTSVISACEPPHYFIDEMVKGPFRSIHHKHEFISNGNYTTMIDYFHFEAPLGWLGKIANSIFLASYMKKFLVLRNNVIKQYAESDLWKTLLPVNSYTAGE